MALLFYDGFEGLAAGNGQLALRYEGVNGSAQVKNGDTPPPDGGYYLESGTFVQNTVGKNVTGHASGVVGFRFRTSRTGSVLAGGGNPIIYLGEQGTGGPNHLFFSMPSDAGTMRVARGDLFSNTQLGVSGVIFSVGVWSYIEIKYVIDDTDGGVWIRQNGVDVLRLGAYAVSPTTLDTRNGGTTTVNRVTLGALWNDSNAARSFGYDDVYVVDQTGAAPYNDFLGPVRVLELTPDAAGASAQFTPSAGTNHEAVDEVPGHDGDTTYVESGTAGHRDLYNLTTATVSSVLAVKTIAVARRTDAGPTELELSVRSGSTTGDSTPKLLADTFGEHAHTFLINPDTTNPWQPGELAGLQAGIKVPT